MSVQGNWFWPKMHSRTSIEGACEGWILSGVAKYICDKRLTEMEKKLLLFCFLPFPYRSQGFSQFDPEASFDSLLLLF